MSRQCCKSTGFILCQTADFRLFFYYISHQVQTLHVFLPFMAVILITVERTSTTSIILPNNTPPEQRANPSARCFHFGDCQAVCPCFSNRVLSSISSTAGLTFIRYIVEMQSVLRRIKRTIMRVQIPDPVHLLAIGIAVCLRQF